MNNLEIDLLDNLQIEDIDFEQAEADIKEFNLDYDFQNIEDLYLDDEDTTHLWYEL